MYKSPQFSYPDILRKLTYQGTDSGILYVPPALTTFEFAPLRTGSSRYVQRDGILLQNYEIHNAAADGTHIGIGFRFGPSHWKVGRLSADYATYTDLTENAQTRVAVTVQVTGADQTGLVIQADRPFGWVSATFTTAETDGGGAVPDHAVQYSNAAGTGWTAIGAVYTDNFTTSNAVWGAGVKNFVWVPPTDWGKVTSLGGLSPGMYALGFTSADREAGDTAAIITGIEVGVMRVYEGVDQYGVAAAEKAEWAEFAADGIVAYFSAANAKNTVAFACRPIG